MHIQGNCATCEHLIHFLLTHSSCKDHTSGHLPHCNPHVPQSETGQGKSTHVHCTYACIYMYMYMQLYYLTYQLYTFTNMYVRKNYVYEHIQCAHIRYLHTKVQVHVSRITIIVGAFRMCTIALCIYTHVQLHILHTSIAPSHQSYKLTI